MVEHRYLDNFYHLLYLLMPLINNTEFVDIVFCGPKTPEVDTKWRQYL